MSAVERKTDKQFARIRKAADTWLAAEPGLEAAKAHADYMRVCSDVLWKLEAIQQPSARVLL